MKLSRPRKYFRHKVVNPLLAILSMGITPHKLALTVALGVMVGIMPLFGLATLICTLLGVWLRLNIPAMLFICYLLGPLHLLLYLPFIRLGIYIFGASELRFTFDQILNLFRQDWLQALNQLWLANLLGLAAWLLISIPMLGLIYIIMLPVFRKLVRPPVADNPEEDTL